MVVEKNDQRGAVLAGLCRDRPQYISGDYEKSLHRHEDRETDTPKTKKGKSKGKRRQELRDYKTMQGKQSNHRCRDIWHVMGNNTKDSRKGLLMVDNNIERRL